VDLLSTVMCNDTGTLESISPENETYVSVEFSDGVDVLVIDEGTVTVPVEDLVLYVELVTAPNVDGTYNVEIEINPNSTV